MRSSANISALEQVRALLVRDRLDGWRICSMEGRRGPVPESAGRMRHAPQPSEGEVADTGMMGALMAVTHSSRHSPICYRHPLFPPVDGWRHVE